MPQSMIGVVGGVASQDYRSNSYQTLEDDSGTQHESGKAHSLEALVWVVHDDREL
jgi:translation initiation factor 4G